MEMANINDETRDLTRDSLNDLFAFVDSEDTHTPEQLLPRLNSPAIADMLISTFLIKLQWLKELCPFLTHEQFGFLMQVCATLTYSLSTAPFCDFNLYRPSIDLFRIVWFQTRKCIGLFDRFFGFAYLFPRDVFWSLSISDLIRQIDIHNRLAMDRMIHYGIESVQARYAVVKRALQLQKYWYKLIKYDPLRSIFMTDADLVIPNMDGPCPGHPDRKAPIWTSCGNSPIRNPLPFRVISRISMLRYVNQVAVILTQACSNMGFPLADLFTELFPRFRIIIHDAVVVVEDCVTTYLHFIPIGVFFDRTFNFIRAIQDLTFLDPACQGRIPFFDWYRLAERNNTFDGPLFHRLYDFADFTLPHGQVIAITPFSRRFCHQLVNRLNFHQMSRNFDLGICTKRRFELIIKDGTVTIYDIESKTYRYIDSFEFGFQLEDLFSILAREYWSYSDGEESSISRNGSLVRDISSSLLFYHEDVSGVDVGVIREFIHNGLTTLTYSHLYQYFM
jgi:hypothetical protein